MTEYAGLLAYVSEAVDIQRELGISSDEAWKIQRERAAERDRQREADLPSNVIPFRPR